jgi:hypothetical protein
MQHEGRGDVQAPEPELAQGNVVEYETAREIAQTDWEEGWQEVAGETRAQIEGRGRRAPDMHLLAWSKQGFEKPQALDVIHMQMGEQEIEAWHLRS